jgi:hypothetical protein
MKSFSHRERALICSYQVKMNALVLCVHNIVAFQSKRIKRRAICSPDMLIFLLISARRYRTYCWARLLLITLCKNNARDAVGVLLSVRARRSFNKREIRIFYHPTALPCFSCRTEWSRIKVTLNCNEDHNFNNLFVHCAQLSKS